MICSNFLSPFLLQFQSGPNLQHAHPIDGVSFVTMMHNKNSEIQKKNIKRKTKEERRHPRQKKSVLYAELDTLYVRALVHFIPKEARSNVCDTLANTKKRRYFFLHPIPARPLHFSQYTFRFAPRFLFRSSLTIVTQIDKDEEKPNWLSLPDHPKSFGSSKR